MANFNIYWTPAAKFVESQSVEIRHRGDTDYTTIVSGLVPSASSYTATGLDSNTIYEARIASDCLLDDTTNYTNVGSAIGFNCITPTVTTAGNDILFSFSAGDLTDVDQIIVALYRAGVRTTTLTYNAAFASTISGSFLSVDTGVIYQVGIELYADEFSKRCDLSAPIFSHCLVVTGITGSIS